MNRTALVASAMFACLLTAAAGLAAFVVFGGSGADGHGLHDHDASEHGAHSHGSGLDPGRPALYDTGMQRPSFPEPFGSVPTAQEARSFQEFSSLRLHSDDAFTPSNGVRSGSGTMEDPYIIEHIHVTGSMSIQDTDACVVIRESYIQGTLRLNWNGECVHLHHSYVRDLRVNENIRRTGMPTGGFIEHNTLAYVGQIRHFDGIFAHNTVGPRPDGFLDPVLGTLPFPFVENPRVLNADGFHQAVYHANTIHGSVDVKLHGHHHGDDFDSDHSHYHGSDDGMQDEHHHHDHTDRWHAVYFIGNTIIDPEGYGLRYTDRAHRADDRTATSERNEELNKPHQHHTLVVIEDNRVEGAPIWVDVFNQDDQNHPERNPGWLYVRGNTVVLEERTPEGPLDVWGPAWRVHSGIVLHTVKEVEAHVTGNHVVFMPAEGGSSDPVTALTGHFFYRPPASAGVELHSVRDAVIQVHGNTVEGFEHGVRAQRLEADAMWSVMENEFLDVAVPVYYDESVQSRPDTDAE